MSNLLELKHVTKDYGSFKLEDVSAQTYEFGLQLGILAVEVVVDFPEVEVRTYVITRAVDRR